VKPFGDDEAVIYKCPFCAIVAGHQALERRSAGSSLTPSAISGTLVLG